MSGQRMTWAEIKHRYPHQNVGLVDIHEEPDGSTSAIVKYAEENMSREEMFKRAINGEIQMRYTTLDEDCEIVTPFLPSDFIDSV